MSVVYTEIEPVERIGKRVRDRHGRYRQDEARPPCGTLSAYAKADRDRRAGLPHCGPCEVCRSARRHYDNKREKKPAEVARILDQAQRRYGITFVEKSIIFASQGDSCAICKRTDGTPRSWATEHNHATGEVRGVTCLHCNHLIGMAAKIAGTEDPDFLGGILGPVVIEYLRNGAGRVRDVLVVARSSK